MNLSPRLRVEGCLGTKLVIIAISDNMACVLQTSQLTHDVAFLSSFSVAAGPALHSGVPSGGGGGGVCRAERFPRGGRQ